MNEIVEDLAELPYRPMEDMSYYQARATLLLAEQVERLADILESTIGIIDDSPTIRVSALVLQ